MKKFFISMILVALMATTLTCNAFAATLEPNDSLSGPATVDQCKTPTDTVDAPVRDKVFPTRSWLAEQIRYEITSVSSYYNGGKLHATFRLSDATKIIFIANEVCPVEYDQNGNLWVTNINIPCGISMKDYRFLDLTSRLAAQYGEGGVETLANLYAADELSEIYAELKELAPANYSDLIAWLDDFCVEMTVPALLPVPAPEPAPAPVHSYERPNPDPDPNFSTDDHRVAEEKDSSDLPVYDQVVETREEALPVYDLAIMP